MLDFPNTPNTGDIFQGWQWDGVKWMPAPQAAPIVAAPECCKLTVYGTSPGLMIQLLPYNGNLIKINGVLYQIPAAGIQSGTGLNQWLNGAAGTLAFNTLYYVYLWRSPSGQLVLDFSTTGFVMSTTPGNVGVAIKSGDDTRSLVGMAYPGGTSPNVFYDQANNRLVRSWFNRGAASLYGTGSASFYAQTALVQLAAVSFAEQAFLSGGWYGTSPAADNFAGYVFVPNVSQGNSGQVTTVNTTAAYVNFNCGWAGGTSMGFQTFILYANSTGNQGQLANGPSYLTGMLG